MSDSSFGDTGFGDGGFDDAGSDLGGSDLGGSDLGGSDLGGSDLGGSDTGTDLGTDTGSDFGTDTGSDFGSDTGSDFGTDTGSDFGTDTNFGTDTDTDFGTGTDVGAGTDFDAGTPGSTGDGFSVTPAALSDVSSTFDGLIGDGRDATSTLGGLALDPASFGTFGSPVASAAQSLMGNHTTALDGTLSGLGVINDGITQSNQGYLAADQAVSDGFGGVPTLSGTQPHDPFSTANTAQLPTFANLPADQQQAVDTLDDQALTTSGLTLGTTPYDPFSTTTTPTAPTFTDLPADQQQAIDTLNTQDTQTTPAGLADDATLQAQLQQHEGAKNHVYTDTMGHPTVGIGFNLDRSGAANALSAVGADYTSVRNGTQDLTDAQISQLAHTDTQHAVDVARNYYSGFDQLDPARQRALVDMTFNLDNKINQFTGLHQALVNGDWNPAAIHIATSASARQTGNRGVDLTNQMRNGGQ